MNNWNDKLEFGNKLMAVAFKIGVFVGGFAICVYSRMINYLPTGVTVGDGLLFLLIATVVSGIIAFYSFSFVSLGIVMWRCVYLLLTKGLILANKITSKELTLGSSSIVRRVGVEYYGFALFGLFPVETLAKQDWRSFTHTLVILFISFVIWNHYQNNGDAMAELLNSDKSDEDKLALQKHLKIKKSVFLVVLFISPLTIFGSPEMLVTNAMRMSKVRIESATVHIKQPYTTYATEYGLKGEDSKFGGEFLKFENTKVLLTGIGTKTVLSLKGEKGSPVQLVVPNAFVHVLPEHHS